MKIAQFYEKGRIRLGLVHGNDLVPVDFEGDMVDFIRSGKRPETFEDVTTPLDQVKLAPPVTRPSKIIALGLNYRDHADESKGKEPEVPLPDLISFLSRHFTLIPGDIILTGTPSGVGAFREPSVYMKDGDEAVVEIEGIGRLVNVCKTG